MIQMIVKNPEKFKSDIERFIHNIVDAVENDVLKDLAEATVTNITSGIDRQVAIDGSTLKANSPATVARKLGLDPKTGVPVRIGAKAKAAQGGIREVRSLVDKGILRKPSTYEVRQVERGKYEISVRAIKSGDPDDKVTRDLVTGYVMDKGYNFFGVPKIVLDNAERIIKNRLQQVSFTL